MTSPTETAERTPRLANQLAVVERIMADQAWHTLAGVAAIADAPEASVSARIRDLRRNGYVVDRRKRQGTNQYEYRATPAPPPDMTQTRFF